MTQCPSCGGDCGGTKKTGCLYGATHADKERLAATTMVERPLWLIKQVLIQHERAVMEVMIEQQKKYNDLVDRVLKGTKHDHIDDWLKEQGK